MPERRHPVRRPTLVALGVGVAAVGLLVAAALVVYARAEDALRNQASLRVQDTATLAAQYVGEETLRFSELVEGGAQQLAPLSKQPLERLTPAQAAAVRNNLRELRSGAAGLRAAALISPSGRLLLADPPAPALTGRSFAGRDWYRGVTQRRSPYVSRVFRAADGPTTVTVAALVRPSANGPVTAILTAGLEDRAQSLADAFASAHGVGVVVTDQDGYVIAQSGASANMFGSLSSNPEVHAALGGRSGTGERRGTLAGYAPIPAAGWAVMATLPTRVAFRADDGLGTILLLVTTILGAILAALVAGLVVLLHRSARGQDAEAERLRGLLESAPDATVVTSELGGIVMVNAQAERLFGYSRDQLLGKSVELLIPKRYRGAHVDHRAGFFANPSPRAMGAGRELYALGRDGTEFPVEISLSPLQTPNGILVSSAIRDIRERRRIESSLREAEEQLALSFDHSPLGITLSAPDGRPVRINRTFAEMIGYSVEELVGVSDPKRLTHPDDRPVDDEHVRLLLNGSVDSTNWEKRYMHADGSTVWASVSVSLLRHADGAPRLLIAQVEDISARKRSEDAVARLAAIVESSDDAIIGKTLEGVIKSWNPAAERMYGFAAGEAIGRDASLLAPSESEEGEIREIDRRVASGEGVVHAETIRRRRDGALVDVSITVSPICDARGTIVGVSTVARDITEHKRAEDALRDAEERFRQAFEEAPIGMAMLGLDGRFQQVNDALCEITGYSRRQLESTSSQSITHPDDLEADARELAGVLAGEAEGYRIEKRYLGASGDPVWVTHQATLIHDSAGAPVRLLLQVQDVTDRRRYEERLRHLADHDALTGLLNRRSFERELDAHRARVGRYGLEGAALVLDLDHFKYINDTLGHSAGDEAIVKAAHALSGRLRESDVLARLGGDEFAVLLPKADISAARLVTEELLEALRQQNVELGGRPRPLTASAGIALFEDEQVQSGEDVLVNADLAMYDAKNAGRDRVAIYSGGERDRSRMKGRVTWAQRIGTALEHEGFTLLAQPIVELRTGNVSQYELLLRMRDEHGDLVPPAAFLYVAERLGIVRDIDEWVTRQAIDLIASARADGSELTLEVNLSGLSIGGSGFVEYVKRELERADIPPESLIFELTETAAVTNVVQAGRFARALTELGCRFALDDFGAGYGSFQYLKHIPFNFLKIDGEFVKGCQSNKTDRLLIKAVVDLATGMSKRTIAEFVGDEETVRLLSDLGVDFGQGYFLGRPAPLMSWNGAAVPKTSETSAAPRANG